MIPDTILRILRRIPYASGCFGKSKRILRRVRYGKESHHRIAYLARLRKGTPIVVYTIGRVGSRSIQRSLISRGIEPVFHIHALSPSGISQARARRKALGAIVRSPDLSHGEWLYSDFVKRSKRMKVIAVVREPISWIISEYFAFFPGYTDVEYGADFTIEELASIFWTRALHAEALNWFDVEMKQALGIDVYNYPFPQERGYVSIEQDNFNLLIIKLEIDDSVKEEAIAEFLGVEDFRMVARANTAEERGYIQTYRNFQQAIKLPESYMELMYNSKYVRHFYSDKEIEAIKLKWQGRIVKTELPVAVHEELLGGQKDEQLFLRILSSQRGPRLWK